MMSDTCDAAEGRSAAAAAPDSPPEWFDRYSARVEESRLPKGQEARYAHGEDIGTRDTWVQNGSRPKPNTVRKSSR